MNNVMIQRLQDSLAKQRAAVKHTEELLEIALILAVPEELREDELKNKIRLYCDSGHFIQAIKLVRAVTSKGLKEAKEYVDAVKYSISDQGFYDMVAEINNAPIGATTSKLNESILLLVSVGYKIRAIRLHRTITGSSLLDAKHYVERLTASQQPPID